MLDNHFSLKRFEKYKGPFICPFRYSGIRKQTNWWYAHTFQFNQRPHAFQLRSFAVIIPLHPADIPLVSIDQWSLNEWVSAPVIVHHLFSFPAWPRNIENFFILPMYFTFYHPKVRLGTFGFRKSSQMCFNSIPFGTLMWAESIISDIIYQKDCAIHVV